MLLAVLLVAAGGGIAAELVASGDPRTSVLVTARPVPAGQALSAKDVRVARVAVDSSLHLIRADQRASVLGRPAAVPLAAGELLTTSMLGDSRWPGAGFAVVAVPVKQGQYPPSIHAGSTVDVLFAAGPNSGSAPAGGASQTTPADVTGVVTSVAPGSARDGSAVVELRLPVDGAKQIAAASAVTLLAVEPAR